MRKWNPKTHKYEPYEIPSHWFTPVYSYDMDVVVNCAQCGKKLPYWESHVSRQIHNSLDLGYPVCPTCHAKEYREEMSAMDENNNGISETMTTLLNLYQSREHMAKLTSNSCSLIAVDYHIKKLEKRLIQLLEVKHGVREESTE